MFISSFNVAWFCEMSLEVIEHLKLNAFSKILGNLILIAYNFVVLISILASRLLERNFKLNWIKR